MSTVNGVTAICMLAVDGQPKTGHQLKCPFGDYKGCRCVFRLGAAIVRGTGYGQHCHIHCDRSQEIQNGHHEEDATHNDESEKKTISLFVCFEM